MKKKANVEAELDSNGKMGELSFWVGDKLVEEKRGSFLFPRKKNILEAVQKEQLK